MKKNYDDDWGDVFDEDEIIDVDDKAIIPIHTTTPVTANSTEMALLEDEIGAIEQSFGYLRAAWPMARTVDQICKLALTTGKMLETRRNLFDRTKKNTLDGADIIDMFTEDEE